MSSRLLFLLTLFTAPVVILAQFRDDIGCQSHTDDICLPDEYCAAEQTFNFTTRCLHCVTCKNDYETFDGLECPKKCQCTSDDDCPRGSICSDYENSFSDPPTGYRICQSCLDACKSVASCPSSCWCSNSAVCPSGTFCDSSWRSSGNNNNQIMNDGRNICMSCSRGDGCAQFALVNGQNETCLDVCGADLQEFECSSHADCQMLHNDSSSWCSQNHKCNECSSDCWTDARRTGDLNTVPRYERFRAPIDLGCPASCCNWEPQFSPFPPSIFGLCANETSTSLEVRVARGDHFDWTVGDFLSRAKMCDMERLELNDGLLPKVVIAIDQSCAMDPGICKEANYTFAVISRDGKEDARFYDNASYPFVILVSNKGDSCQSVFVVRFLRIFFISSGIILVFLCIFCCRWMHRRGPRQSSSEEATIIPVPKD